MKLVKKIIIPFLILFVFTAPIWLAFKYSTYVVNPNTGEKKPWTIKSLFNNGYYKISRQAEIYENDCQKPFTDKQFIEFQFGDIRLRYPCTVNRSPARLMIVGDNDGFQKHYYLRMDFNWREELGIIWWNNLPIDSPYQYDDFDLHARIFFRKNSQKVEDKEFISYKRPFPKVYDFNSLELFKEYKSENTSIYRVPQTNSDLNFNTILIKLNGIFDPSIRIISAIS